MAGSTEGRPQHRPAPDAVGGPRRAGLGRALRLVLAVVLLTVGSWSTTIGPAEAETTEFDIDDPRLTTLAGLARADGEDFYWAVEEGAEPEAFVLSEEGELLGSVGFRADVVDLEAVASTSDGLYLADIGDDQEQRDLLTVYRLLNLQPGAISLYNAWDLVFDDGEPRDAEALLVTPEGDLRIVDRSGDPGIWAPDGPLTAEGENTLERIADAPAGVSDATVLSDGRFALRTAAGVSVLDPDTLQEVASVAVETDEQSSSITETLDGEALLLGSKATAAPVTRIAVPEGLEAPGDPGGSPSAPGDPTTDDPGTEQQPADEAQAQQGSGPLTGVAPWIFGVLLLLGLLVVAVAVRRSRSEDSDSEDSDSEEQDEDSEGDRTDWWSGGGSDRADPPDPTDSRHETTGRTPRGGGTGGGTTAAGPTAVGSTGGVGLLATPSRRVTHTERDIAGPRAEATPRRALLDPAEPAQEDTPRPDGSTEKPSEQQEREQQEREQQERERRARRKRARARKARAARLEAAESAAAGAQADAQGEPRSPTVEQPDPRPTAQPVEQATPLPVAVRVEDVHVRYRVYASGKAIGDGGRKLLRPSPRGIREVHALQGISFTARQGESIGVIGSNGSGKSTLMRTITGLTPPSEGAVWASARPNLLGVGAALLPALSGERNIVLGGLALGLTKAEIAELRDEIVDFAELSEFIDLPMRTYSSGMQQRLKFAIASAKQHEILIVDEALAVGDKRFRDRSEARIRTIREAAGTIFLVSHSMASIRDTCTRAIWLEKGTLMGDGEPDAVIKAYEKHKK